MASPKRGYVCLVGELEDLQLVQRSGKPAAGQDSDDPALWFVAQNKTGATRQAQKFLLKSGHDMTIPVRLISAAQFDPLEVA